jgi:hypothetical protein
LGKKINPLCLSSGKLLLPIDDPPRITVYETCKYCRRGIRKNGKCDNPVAPQTSDVLVTYRTSWRQLYLRQLPYGAMADSLMSYAITAGIFAFLTAVLFSARFARKRHGEMTPESKHTEAA